jgi:DinB family
MPYSGQEYAQAFLMHRAPLLELLGQIPVEKGSFAAWDGGKNFIELTDHLKLTNLRMSAMIAGEKPSSAEPSTDLASARAALEAASANLTDTVSQLSSEQLEAVVDAFGGMKMPVYKLLDFAREHDAHHKGQLWTMARMIGVQPPMFVKFG